MNFNANEFVIADYNQDNRWYVGMIKKVENAKRFQVIFFDKPTNSLEIEKIRNFDDWIYEDKDFPCIIKDIDGAVFTVTKVNKDLKTLTGYYRQLDESEITLPFEQVYLDVEAKKIDNFQKKKSITQNI